MGTTTKLKEKCLFTWLSEILNATKNVLKRSNLKSTEIFYNKIKFYL